MISKQNLEYQVSWSFSPPVTWRASHLTPHTSHLTPSQASGRTEKLEIFVKQILAASLVRRVWLDMSTSLLQSSHIPHNETDLSYNLVTVPVSRPASQSRAVLAGLLEIEQFQV